MITLDVKTEGDDVGEALGALADGLRPTVRTIAIDGGANAAASLQREIRARLTQRSGRLAGSVGVEPRPIDGGHEVAAGATAPYARVQDEGNTDHGLGAARAMAIPAFGASRTSPRGIGGLVAVPAKGGPILALRDGKRGLRTQFFLRRSVVMRGVHYREAAARSVEGQLPGVTERRVAHLLEEAARAGA